VAAMANFLLGTGPAVNTSDALLSLSQVVLVSSMCVSEERL
jgi:hypothetical protein